MNVLITAYSFVAAVIGAGFASGQEILTFFTIYGKWGALGIILSAVIFGGFAYLIIETCRRCSISDYNTLSDMIMSKKMKKLSDILTFIFLLCSFAVMTACFGEMMYIIFGFNKGVMSALFVAVCTSIICTGADKALKLNGILGIITSAGIIAAVLYILRFREHQTFSPQVSAVISGGGYSGYNLIGTGVILANMSKNIRSRREALLTGAVSGASLLVMMGLIYFLLSIYYKYINLGEIPMLTLAMRENKVITYFYSVMLVLAVVTTAISGGVGAAELAGFKNKFHCILFGAVGFCISCAGFSAVINTAYRLCGYAGIIIILYISKNMKKAEKHSKTAKIEALSENIQKNSP